MVSCSLEVIDFSP